MSKTDPLWSMIVQMARNSSKVGADALVPHQVLLADIRELSGIEVVVVVEL